MTEFSLHQEGIGVYASSGRWTLGFDLDASTGEEVTGVYRGADRIVIAVAPGNDWRRKQHRLAAGTEANAYCDCLSRMPWVPTQLAYVPSAHAGNTWIAVVDLDPQDWHMHPAKWPLMRLSNRASRPHVARWRGTHWAYSPAIFIADDPALDARERDNLAILDAVGFSS